MDNPEEVGMGKTDLNKVLETLENQVIEGLHTGAQLHVSRKGQTVLDVAVGEAKPGIQMRNNSILSLWSSGKPWTSVAIAQLWENGKLEINQTVQSIIPEFKNGKEKCTIKHLLIHAGGFPMLLYPKWLTASWDEIIMDACNEIAEYTPGTKCGYHPRISWIILGEIIHRIDGRRIDDYLKEEIFLPLGMNSSYLGMTKERARKLGDLLALKDTPDESEKIHLWINNFEGRIFPGTNGYSTANDMGKFYRALWNGGEWDGKRILKKDTVNYFTTTHRKGIADLTFSTPALQIAPDWGFGFAKGKSNSIISSENAFGHGGRSSCVNFCDPQVDLVINFNSNTMLGLEQNLSRMIAIISKIYDACRYKFN
ncbi:MAG: beta-lactamase family protein [Candidatus Lokiarchaeota archaeon]|nr:beta-lactamase family protein [Candidatus Lokiarchaeota archaeon]